MSRVIAALVIVVASCQPSSCATVTKHDASVSTGDAELDAHVHPPQDSGANGSIVLSISTRGNSNCTGGITAMSLVLVTASGACVPVTILHQRGATTVGTYTAMCPRSAAMPCVEVGDTLTIRPVTAGAYFAHVDGSVGDVPCWQGDASIGVLDGVATTQTLGLLKQGDPRCLTPRLP